MNKPVTCGEATIRLLEQYGVTTLFGIPGVHTLDFCRGLGNGVRHIQARNEQGAGFMAEGWARATGRPGVALVISGPGVTNASTAIGQAWADSLPVLLISAEAAGPTIGKGWGVLHEITEQKKVTEPLTALSATARCAADVPELLAQAFSLFASQRPRPVHVSIPIDVQAEPVEEEWSPVTPPGPPAPDARLIESTAQVMKSGSRPVIMVGGGARHAADGIRSVAESLGAIVIASTAGKGIIPDDHPLSLSASTVRPETLAMLGEADAILAIGTELSETDSFVERMPLHGKLVRIDIDASKINDFYPAEIGIVADARLAADALALALEGHRAADAVGAAERADTVRQAISANLSASEVQHNRLLRTLDAVAPDGTIWCGDACQLVYTGAFRMPARHPGKWFYPAGYCALGNALPNAIGAKLALPEAPVAVLVGDGGFMFTMPELMTAAELELPLPIIIWENGGLKQIQDDMDGRGIPRVGVEGINPDFPALARACHCHGVRCSGPDDAAAAFLQALERDRPTVIVIEEDR
ncbi:MAG: 5-guanidino-2-oxopentanoate decarboxylase [Gammaproteobacteria bacterium]|nr:5-guanidino-2-oxopentanoate decarboxylase [Gammaproteobacteria bacterium]MYD77052.1 5-guanidino-2-oxopentanoate decarboxylase [Gammaproteobacteria bacterium]MYJ53111.1 5-guanidino-2-oxopentanoate decarboxylase [Gammaproteobacteria bacterium]